MSKRWIGQREEGRGDERRGRRGGERRGRGWEERRCGERKGGQRRGDELRREQMRRREKRCVCVKRGGDTCSNEGARFFFFSSLFHLISAYISSFLSPFSLSLFPLSSCLFLFTSGEPSPILRGQQSGRVFCSYTVDSCYHLGPHLVGQKPLLDWGPYMTGLDTSALPHPSLHFWLTLCWLLSPSVLQKREWY